MEMFILYNKVIKKPNLSTLSTKANLRTAKSNQEQKLNSEKPLLFCIVFFCFFHKIVQVFCFSAQMCVVYFYQHLGTAHSKALIEICVFNIFCAKKLKKEPLTSVLVIAPECWSKTFFCWIAPLSSCFFFLFQLFSTKTLKKHIMNSIWSAQHQNASQNI